MLSAFWGCQDQETKPGAPYKAYQQIISAQEKKDLKNLKKQFLQNYQGYQKLKEIANALPHRNTGSKYGKAAEEFVYNLFKDYGLRVRYEPFDMKRWKRDQASLSIHTPTYAFQVQTLAFPYSPKYANVTAEVVDVGDGLYTDFARVGKERIKGKIVLSNMWLDSFAHNQKKIGNPARSHRAHYAYLYGAKGVIFVNKTSGHLLTTGTVSKEAKEIKIPATSISKEHGRKIRRYLATGFPVQAHLHVQGGYEEVRPRNVVATIPGLEFPQERILIGGHLDTWDMAPGATDNGIGIFAVIDIARAFKQAGIIPKRTIEFFAWMGEEHGLVGSKMFLKRELEQGRIDNIKYYLNIDLMGNPVGYDIEGRLEMKDFLTGVAGTLDELGVDFANRFEDNPTMAAFYDVVTFGVMGIPSLQEVNGLDPHIYKYYHTKRDTFDLVNKKHMQKSSLVMGITLYKIANADNIPAKRFDLEKTVKFYKEYGGLALLQDRFHWNLRKKIEKAARQKKK
jgi:Iap family predicted aminopeptidase